MLDKALMKNRTAQKGLIARIVADYKYNKFLIYMAIPVVLYYIVFKYIPIYGVIIAFKDFNVVRGVSESAWVGFDNFLNFFNSFYFERVVSNTLILTFMQLVIGFPAPIILAFLLNEVRHSKFKRTVQTVTYMPHFISIVVICGMIVQFVDTNGVINTFLGFFGLPAQNYLNNPDYFKSIYVISNVWQNAGYGSIIYLAALSRVNKNLYEACEIDGGGRWKQFLHVTFPCLLPTITIMFILRVGKIMNLGAEKIVLLYNPSTYIKADIISSFVYRRGIENADYSFAAAIDLLNNVINCTLILVANWLSRKTSETSLW